MAVKLANRAWMTTATTGTGTITLGSAKAGYQSFAAAGILNTNEVRYTIQDGNNWEIGVGVYTSSGTTMTRTPSQSSSAGAAINLSGTATVFLTAIDVDIDNSIGGDPIVLPSPFTDVKQSVRVATTADVTLSGEQTIDGVAVVADERVLVKSQTAGAANGVYDAKVGAWVRSDDADVDAEVTSGMIVFVEEGTVSADVIYALVTNDPIVVGTTVLTFVPIILPGTASVIKSVTAATNTLIATDPGKLLQMNRATAQTLTVPPQSSVSMPVGAEIWVINWGVGIVTIAAGAGVTIPSEFGLVLPRQYAMGRLKKMASPNAWSWTLVSAPNPTESLVIAASDETTAITAGTAKTTFRMPYAFILTAVRASLTTAQASGSIFTVDIHEGATTVLSTKITIDNTEKTSTTAAAAPVISDASLADDAEMRIDVDQIGDGTAKGLKVVLIGRRT